MHPPSEIGATERSPLRIELFALLLVSFVLLAAWSLAVPMFEGPDEQSHWQYAAHLHEHRELPRYSVGFEEANSPPLYYALLAPFAPPAETPRPRDWIDEKGVVHIAPGVWRFDRSASDLSRYPVLRRARLITCLFSVATILFVYLAGREVTGSSGTGLLAAGLTLGLPQFTFRGMNISNDAAVTAFAALTTYFIVRIVRRPFSWRIAIAGAAALALTFLAKTTALFLPLPFALAILSTTDRWPERLRRLMVMGVSLAIVAPLLARNYVLYGDILASRAMFDAVPHIVDEKSLFSPYFVTMFPKFLAASFVGVLGWMTIWLPPWIYGAYTAVGIGSAAGLIKRIATRAIAPALLLLLVLIALLNFGVVVRINLTFTQPQGRYLFPSLPAIMLLAALGLESFRWWSRRVTLGLVGVLLLINVNVLVRIVWRLAHA